MQSQSPHRRLNGAALSHLAWCPAVRSVHFAPSVEVRILVYFILFSRSDCRCVALDAIPLESFKSSKRATRHLARRPVLGPGSLPTINTSPLHYLPLQRTNLPPYLVLSTNTMDCTQPSRAMMMIWTTDNTQTNSWDRFRAPPA